MGSESAGGAAQEKDIKHGEKNPVRQEMILNCWYCSFFFWVPEQSLCVSDALKEETNHEEKNSGNHIGFGADIFCDGRSWASAEDRLWENSMEADGVEDDISQNQTEVKDGDDSTSEDNEENTENEGVDSPENDTEAEEDPSEVKEETEISFEEEQESIEAEVEENPEQELELDAEMGEEDLFMDNENQLLHMQEVVFP